MSKWIRTILGHCVRFFRKTPLVKSRFLKNIYYALYQSTRPQELTLLQLASGLKIWVDPADQGVASFLILTGDYEPFERSLVEQTLCEGDWALDIGGNIGYHAIHMAKAVGPTGKIISCEPSPQNFALLQKNVCENQLKDQVECHECAIGSERGDLNLYLNEHNRGDHRIFSTESDQRSSISVPVYPMDDLVPLGSEIKLIKMDIQGAEWLALQGMTRILSENENIHIFMEFWPNALREAQTQLDHMLDFFFQNKFHLYQIFERHTQVIPISRPKLDEMAQTNEEYNLLLLKNIQQSPLKAYCQTSTPKT